MANRTGRTAVVDRHSVAIFTPVERNTVEGMRYVSFKVNRVRTFEEARRILLSLGNPVQRASTGRRTAVPVAHSAPSTTHAADRSEL